MTSSCQSCSYHRRCVQEPWETKQSNDYCSFQDKWLKKKKFFLNFLEPCQLPAKTSVLAIWITSYQERKCQEEKEKNQTRTIPKNKTKTWVTDHIWTTGFTPQDVEPFHGSTYGPVQKLFDRNNTHKKNLFLLQFEHHSPGEEPQDGVRFYCSTNLSRNMGGFD